MLVILEKYRYRYRSKGGGERAFTSLGPCTAPWRRWILISGTKCALKIYHNCAVQAPSNYITVWAGKRTPVFWHYSLFSIGESSPDICVALTVGASLNTTWFFIPILSVSRRKSREVRILNIFKTDTGTHWSGNNSFDMAMYHNLVSPCHIVLWKNTIRFC